MTERKLVTVRSIDALKPIDGADAIEMAVVGGWKLVVKKGEFNVGDYCVYFEIDSFLPEFDSRFAFLMKSGVREFEGVRGHKLRTIKLRGQISQGLALPYAILGRIAYLGEDVTEELGIKKWEATIPANMAGQVKGAFPSFIRKTDQERCQNIVEEIFVDNLDSRYEVSIKLDGSSVTFYNKGDTDGVCSRNLELKINDENKDNALVKMYVGSGLQEALFNRQNLAIQGELMGPGIQGNREDFKTTQFFVFDIQDLNTGEYLTPTERVVKMGVLGCVPHVPVLHVNVTLAELGITNVDELLKYAEGKSINHAVREGLVFKRMDGKFSFKAISNRFLEKEKD